MSKTIDKKINEITKLREEYSSKERSWGLYDADKWWITQLQQALSEVERESKEPCHIFHKDRLEVFKDCNHNLNMNIKEELKGRT